MAAGAVRAGLIELADLLVEEQAHRVSLFWLTGPKSLNPGDRNGRYLSAVKQAGHYRSGRNTDGLAVGNNGREHGNIVALDSPFQPALLRAHGLDIPFHIFRNTGHGQGIIEQISPNSPFSWANG